MRGGLFHRAVWLGLALSVVMHVGVGFVANTVSMEAAARAARLPTGPDDQFTLNLVEQDQAPPAPADPEVEKPLADAEPILLPPPPTPPMTAQEHEIRVALGIDESDQKTDNWLGFPIPSEHRARKSLVEQAQLDPNPGASPSPSAEAANRAPMALSAQPEVPPLVAAQPTPAGPKSPEFDRPPGDLVLDGRPDGSDKGRENAPAREGDDAGKSDKLVLPVAGVPTPHPSSSDGPGPKPPPQGNEGTAPKGDTTAPLTPKSVEPQKASAAAGPPGVRNSLPGTGRYAGREYAADSAEPGSARPNAAAGSAPPGEKPGEKSEKEADASSLKDAVDVLPGRPAAAQGLDITTKRPVFSYLTRVTAYPDNPLLKVTFNRLGLVTKVQVIESSGAPDVDGPVVNAVYQWTAKGKVLRELAAAGPGAGVTINIRIILR